MFSFTCLFICPLYKQLGNQRFSTCLVEYWALIKSFILYALDRATERYGRFWRSRAANIGVTRCGIRVPILDLFMLKLCFGLLFHGFQLIQKGLIADLEDFGCLPPVPARLSQHSLNGFPLSLHRR